MSSYIQTNQRSSTTLQPVSNTMNKYAFLFIICFMMLQNSFLQSQTTKGMYVDGFQNIVGNTILEDSLLNYAQFNGFNYLALYGLNTFHTSHSLTNASTCTTLANFIQRAKQNFGITRIGAPAENFTFFNSVLKIYNQQHNNPLQKLDVFNVEFEYWNVVAGDYYCTTYLQPGGYSCDTAGAFSYYKKLIFKVDSLANSLGIISEVYIGWPNQGQAVTIANTVDRILLHDYVSNFNSIYGYIKPRLQLIAARNSITTVLPIFSAEPGFMGPWLNAPNNVAAPYNDLQTSLNNETGAWKQYIDLAGFQWFAYSFMPYNVSVSGTENQNNSVINFYPNPLSTQATLLTDKPMMNATLTVYNSYGQKVKQINNIFGQTIALSRDNLPSGLYFIRLTQDNKTFMSDKFVIIDK
jgi:hypothetical protein